MLNDGAVEYEDGTPATEAQVGFLPFPESCLLVPVIVNIELLHCCVAMFA